MLQGFYTINYSFYELNYNGFLISEFENLFLMNHNSGYTHEN